MTGRGRTDDCEGQWLLLIALIVAIGMTVLLVFINQSMLAGHSSAASIMDFPKNDVREARAETVSEAYVLATQANAAPDISTRKQWFSDNFTRYAGDIRYLYASRGALLNVNYVPGSNETLPPERQRIENVTLYIYYNNGDTMYNETVTQYL